MITAVERLLAEQDRVPETLASPLLTRLEQLGRRDLAATLAPSGVEVRRALPSRAAPARL